MGKITVEGPLLESFTDVTETVEVRDATGWVLGWFSPSPPVEEEPTELTPEVMAGYDPEKSRERRNGPWITKDELFARLDARLGEQ